MIYEWSAAKAASNLRKHGLSLEEATTVFSDPLAVTFSDPDHSTQEQREITIGHTISERAVFVAHSVGEDRIRIISVRLATRSERRQYEEGIRKSD